MHRPHRLISLIAVLALLATACGGGDDSETAATADDASDVAAETDDPGTTAPTTTEAIPEGASGVPSLQITFIEFGAEGFFELTNTGSADADVHGIFFCQFPTYTDLGTVVEGGVIPAGATIQIPAGVAGGLSIDGGEAALYSKRDFGNSEAIFSYVQWGSGGGRSAVAADAGIWPADASVTPDPTLGNLELGGDPADPESWS